MSKQVWLNLGNGNLQQGFPFVTLRLQSAGKTWECSGSLPAAPNIVDLYRRWQLLYELLYQSRSLGIRSPSLPSIDEDDDICIDDADITHVSAADFDNICQELQQSLDRWLDSEGFRPIERQLRKQLSPEDEISLIVQTEDTHLRKLPWYIWQFFHDYPLAEVSLGSFNFEPKKHLRSANQRVRILAILGDSAGIDLKQDQKLLTNLPGAEIVFLVEPQRQALNEKLWDKQGWDILFFAGHSSSLEEAQSGQIFINNDTSLTIAQLKNALNQAISKGLQLAIFNSCAGLGLAAKLSYLSLPQMIVMREPVPDRVAQEFLRHFLSIYAEGQSFSLAVREARERLQGIEGDFPGASWLPVIFQNPAEVPPTWEQLKQGIAPNRYQPKLSISPRRPKFKLWKILSSSLIVTIIIMGLRWLGVFQSWELKAFDFLLSKLPPETADSRILIVGVEDEDIRRYGYPLPDRILAQVITKLKQYQPTVVGVDLLREYPIPRGDSQGHQALANLFQQDSDIVTICFGSNPDNSIAPPPQSPREQVGFIDLYDDRVLTGGQDDSIRRYLLSRSPNVLFQASRCTTDYSFSLQLAYRYFQSQAIPVTTSAENWQFGSTIVKPLTSRSGGYQNLDARGNQLLISYRRTPQIAQQINVGDILENRGNLNPDWVKNRIVLIGTTERAIAYDIHDTLQGEMYGVHVHAHVVSQLINAVEDNRPILWWLPQWGDAIWILCWSPAGGIVVGICPSPLARSLGMASSCAILLGVSWLVLIQGGWLPVIPAAIAIWSTGGIIWKVSIM